MSDEKDNTRRHLALADVVGFTVICVVVITLIATLNNVEAWAAGLLGTIVGAWGTNLAQSRGYYFGSSQSNAANRATIDRMLDVQSDSAKLLAEKVPPAVAPAVKVVKP